jgi:hypothetical protein
MAIKTAPYLTASLRQSGSLLLILITRVSKISSSEVGAQLESRPDNISSYPFMPANYRNHKRSILSKPDLHGQTDLA